MKLNGEGFKALVEQGDKVEAGQPLLEMDLAYIEENAVSIITPIIFTNLLDGETLTVEKSGHVQLKETNIIKIQ